MSAAPRDNSDHHQSGGAARPELTLMALSVATLTRRQEIRPLIDSTAKAVDQEVLIAQLARARLLPTLGPRVVEALGDDVDPSLAAAVERSIVECRRQDALLALISDQILATLGAANVRGASLKGPQLGESIHGEAGRRLSSDIDLLVDPAHLGRASAEITALGYDDGKDTVDALGLPLLHLTFVHRDGTLPPVELHWRIHWYETRFAVERLLPERPSDASWRPEPADELAALLLYFARDGFTGLRQAADLGAWWDRYGERLEPGALGSVAAAFPSLRPALTAALIVAEQRVGLPAELLHGGPVRLGARGRIAVRLADPRPFASEEQLFAEIGLIDGLLSPPGSLREFARRQVAPSSGAIEAKRRRSGKGKELSPLGYSVRTVGRYGLALGRLAHLPLVERARFP